LANQDALLKVLSPQKTRQLRYIGAKPNKSEFFNNFGLKTELFEKERLNYSLNLKTNTKKYIHKKDHKYIYIHKYIHKKDQK
jgi:hypothetical protein